MALRHIEAMSRRARLCVEVGSVGSMRLGVPRHLLWQEAGETEPNLQRRLVKKPPHLYENLVAADEKPGGVPTA